MKISQLNSYCGATDVKEMRLIIHAETLQRVINLRPCLLTKHSNNMPYIILRCPEIQIEVNILCRCCTLLGGVHLIALIRTVQFSTYW